MNYISAKEFFDKGFDDLSIENGIINDVIHIFDIIKYLDQNKNDTQLESISSHFYELLNQYWEDREAMAQYTGSVEPLKKVLTQNREQNFYNLELATIPAKRVHGLLDYIVGLPDQEVIICHTKAEIKHDDQSNYTFDWDNAHHEYYRKKELIAQAAFEENQKKQRTVKRIQPEEKSFLDDALGFLGL